jgi:hypothetical protein
VRVTLATVLFVLTSVAAQPVGVVKSTRLTAETQHYWVYCIGTQTSVEMWALEQMKVRRGSDVCQLHESTSRSGAIDWMEKNFPTHKCSCQE